MCFHRAIPLTISKSKPSSGHANPADIPITSTQKCVECGQMVKSEFKWCPRCGAPLKDHPCAYCGQLLKASEMVCVYCGGPSPKSRMK
ncbi:MAG: hypothetical protein CVU41_12300 [Chloroflexi bacterium HGW-Chloroflexi-3]|nr:MAG: hypothetical protein CVU41_12300 [Chloroflexi bacterium HGW-Chloroflexi-3]